jgi:hypothetical protein
MVSNLHLPVTLSNKIVLMRYQHCSDRRELKMLFHNLGRIILASFMFLLLCTSTKAALVFSDSFETPKLEDSLSQNINLSDTNWTPATNFNDDFPTTLNHQKEGFYGPDFTSATDNYENSQWVELASGDPTKPNSIYKKVPGFIVGQQYELSFYWGIGPDWDDDHTLYVQYAGLNGPDGGQVPYTAETNYLYSANVDQPGWYFQKYLFVAEHANMIFRFRNYYDGGGVDPTSLENFDGHGPLLDEVAINSVPIPGAAYLLATGIVGLAIIRRKKDQ